MEKDLTKGSVFKNVLYFSLPYLLSYFLQTLYGMADLYIVGRFHGVAETTAVSVGSQIMHFVTVMIVGLAMGSTVTIGKAIGACDKQKCAKAIGNTITLFIIVAVISMLVLLFRVDPIGRDVYSRKGGCRNDTVPDHMLYWYPFYYSVQYHQCYFSRNGRLQKSNVFHWNCMPV